MFDAIKAWGPGHKRFVAVGLALTILLQLSVLAVEDLSSVWPLWYGQPVLLRTEPVDPRSLFRGNYVRLNYRISRLDGALAGEPFKRNEVAYVSLEQQGKYHVATGIYREAPGGTFIRGRISPFGADYRFQYGIEAYFMPREKALQAQSAVRQKEAWAEVYLLDNGRAAITRLICEGGCEP